MAADGSGATDDPYVKLTNTTLTPATLSQLQSVIAAANQLTMLSQGQILEAIEAAIQNANLSTLSSSQIETAFINALQNTPAGGASQSQVQEAVIAAITNTLIQAVDFNIKTAINNINEILTEGSFGGDSLFDTISSAIASKLNVQFQEWLSTTYQTVLATTIGATVSAAIQADIQEQVEEAINSTLNSAINNINRMFIEGSFGDDSLRDTIAASVEDALLTRLNSSTITQSISDFFQGSGYWASLAQTELTLKKERIGRIVMYSVTATDNQISIPSDHPWYGQQVELLSWFHNSSATTDSVISVVVSSQLDPQETFAIQINDQSGSFPPGFIVQDSFLIRRLTSGQTFSMIITGRIANTIEDLFIQ